MKTKITLQTELTVVFDEKSTEFQELFENFNEYIFKCDYEEFARHIAVMIAMYGGNEQMEGIGRVLLNGKKQKNFFTSEEYDNPINVIADFNALNDVVEFEIYDCEIE